MQDTLLHIHVFDSIFKGDVSNFRNFNCQMKLKNKSKKIIREIYFIKAVLRSFHLSDIIAHRIIVFVCLLYIYTHTHDMENWLRILFTSFATFPLYQPICRDFLFEFHPLVSLLRLHTHTFIILTSLSFSVCIGLLSRNCLYHALDFFARFSLR